jgi:AcrR family transcriptional regulator
VANGAAARRHTEQGKERKQQLLDHATTLFATRGYANTRVIDICKEAGVAKGLFYWYFENKEALFAELVRSMRGQLEEARAAAIDPAADPLTRLRLAIESSVRFIVLHTEFFTVVRMERREPTVSALLREAADTDVAAVAHLIDEGQQAGVLRAREPATFLAQGVVGSVTTFCYSHRTGRLGLTVDELADLVGRWVVRAVGGASADAAEDGELPPAEADPPVDADRQVDPAVDADQDDDTQAGASVRRLPMGARQRTRVAQTTHPTAPTGISAR